MKIFKKFQINHKYNNGTYPMNIYMIIIFLHAIASVNTIETDPKMPETETTTLKKIQFDLSKNPAIVQQSTKTSISTHLATTISSSSTASPSSSSASSNHLSSETRIKSLAAASVVQHFETPQTRDALATKDMVDMGDCKSLTSVWGDVNPNIFYICDTNTKKPLLLRCPEGRGFFLGFGYSGCIPYEDWPACVSVKHHEQVVVCDREHMQQPWETMNPNKFYVCLQETIEPTLLNCEPGKGFVHAVVNGREVGGMSEIVGCANWEKWRSYMQCNEYY